MARIKILSKGVKIMEKTANQDQNKFGNLEIKLLTTLKEDVFFSQLISGLQELLSCKRIFILKNVGDGSLDIVTSTDDLHTRVDNLNAYHSVAGHVIRTSSPYYSNNTSRDPLFSAVREVIDKGAYSDSELCIPLMAYGQAIGTIHFQDKAKGEDFDQKDVEKISKFLTSLDRPLRNMGMYLSAKNLTEILKVEIEKKDKKLRDHNSIKDLESVHYIKDFELVGRSSAMLRTQNIIDKLAQTDSSVLVVGEVGSGKESIAKKIHLKSLGENRPFVVVQSFMLTEENFEEEMFGHSLDSLGNINKSKSGLCELAEGGTLFFNNVELLSLGVQAKIFYFLMKKKSFKTALDVEKKINVRIMASCGETLERDVEMGRFREDFYYALRGFIVRSPKLSERIDDIETLALHFLNKDRPPLDHKTISRQAIKMLKKYRWPDNIRELRNTMDRAYLLSDAEKEINIKHFPETVISGFNQQGKEEKSEYRAVSLDDLEKDHIVKTLEHLGGNKTRAAKVLGITVKTLYNKLHNYGMISAKKNSAGSAGKIKEKVVNS